MIYLKKNLFPVFLSLSGTTPYERSVGKAFLVPRTQQISLMSEFSVGPIPWRGLYSISTLDSSKRQGQQRTSTDFEICKAILIYTFFYHF
jgi:hypothetical protein